MSGARHASLFSGGGGTDIGLERAGWQTVSLSEIEPYACAVLAERYPSVPNLGDITTLSPEAIPDAELWSAGFPCQDLSRAGRRRGFGGGDRSVLAFTFLDLVERRRPPAVLLENVPGLLTSNAGHDMARLASEMAGIGYGLAYRVLDAQFFGVPQRRRRVYVVAMRSGADDPDGRAAAQRAAQVLSVGYICSGHRAAGHPARPQDAAGPRGGAAGRVAGTLQAPSPHGHWPNGAEAVDGYLVGTAPNADGDGAPAGVARRLDDSRHLAPTLQAPRTGGWRYDADSIESLVYVNRARAHSAEDFETWAAAGVAPTLNTFDVGDVRTTVAVLAEPGSDDPMDPEGLDTARYRLTGNGVAAPVAEWLGRRLLAAVAP